MEMRGIFLTTMVLAVLIVLGCVNNEDVIYVNPNYPYFNITNVSTHRPDINHYTINVTITSSMPEKTIKYANGSIINTGINSTQMVTVSLFSISYKDNFTKAYNSYRYNVTLAYNETKVFTFDLGTLFPGNYTMIVSTPSMNTTYNATMWDYRI